MRATRDLICACNMLFVRLRIFAFLLYMLLLLALTPISVFAYEGTAITEADIVARTNNERLTVGEAPLTISPSLTLAATMKAQDMSNREYFSHDSPLGVTPWHWFDEVDYSYVYAGENLAVHFLEAKAVVESWMKSPSHKDNILHEEYSEIGVGMAKGIYKGKETHYIVQFFGTPQNVIEVAIATNDIAEQEWSETSSLVKDPIAIGIVEGVGLEDETTAIGIVSGVEVTEIDSNFILEELDNGNITQVNKKRNERAIKQKLFIKLLNFFTFLKNKFERTALFTV